MLLSSRRNLRHFARRAAALGIPLSVFLGLYWVTNKKSHFDSLDHPLDPLDPLAQSVLREKATAVCVCYSPGFEFPAWSIKAVAENSASLLAPARVFYDAGDQLEAVQVLVREREPVNIGMERHYNQELLAQTFGWSQGAYGRLESPQPNIGIYTPTLVGGNRPIIHIYHAIGLAFDSNVQPDYINYIETIQPRDRRHLCQLMYRLIFEKIFAAAAHLNMTTIVMSLVGANNFANLYKDWETEEQDTTYAANRLHFQKVVWVPVFHEIAARHPEIEVLFMGTASVGKEVKQAVGDRDLGHFPALLTHPRIFHQLPSTLLINAWDPWSLAGNGNRLDNSLDGFIGRMTNVALGAWSVTNPALQLAQNFIAVR